MAGNHFGFCLSSIRRKWKLSPSKIEISTISTLTMHNSHQVLSAAVASGHHEPAVTGQRWPKGESGASLFSFFFRHSLQLTFESSQTVDHWWPRFFAFFSLLMRLPLWLLLEYFDSFSYSTYGFWLTGLRGPVSNKETTVSSEEFKDVSNVHICRQRVRAHRLHSCRESGWTAAKKNCEKKCVQLTNRRRSERPSRPRIHPATKRRTRTDPEVSPTRRPVFVAKNKIKINCKQKNIDEPIKQEKIMRWCHSYIGNTRHPWEVGCQKKQRNIHKRAGFFFSGHLKGVWLAD